LDSHQNKKTKQKQELSLSPFYQLHVFNTIFKSITKQYKCNWWMLLEQSTWFRNYDPDKHYSDL